MGIKERKKRDFEKRKQLILKTARELFSQKGFSNVTVEDIAEQIEYSKGTIYNHFESKEEICGHLLLEHLSLLLNFLKESAKNAGNAMDGIHKCMEIYIDFYRHNHEYFQLLFFFDIFSNHYRIPKELLKKIQAQKLACLSELRQLLKWGSEDKEIDSDFSSKNIALVMWGMANGIIHLAESKQVKPAELERLIDVAFEIVKKGLKEKQLA